jgi:hypothetical protein
MKRMRLRNIIHLSFVILFLIVGCKDFRPQRKITKLEPLIKVEIETFLKEGEQDRTILFRSFSIEEAKNKKNTMLFQGRYVSNYCLGGRVSGKYNYKEHEVGQISLYRFDVFSKVLEIDGWAFSSSGDPLCNVKLNFINDESATLGTVAGRARLPFEVNTDSMGYFYCKGIPYGRWFVSAMIEQSDGTLNKLDLGSVQTGAWDAKLTAKK